MDLLLSSSSCHTHERITSDCNSFDPTRRTTAQECLMLRCKVQSPTAAVTWQTPILRVQVPLSRTNRGTVGSWNISIDTMLQSLHLHLDGISQKLFAALWTTLRRRPGEHIVRVSHVTHSDMIQLCHALQDHNGQGNHSTHSLLTIGRQPLKRPFLCARLLALWQSCTARTQLYSSGHVHWTCLAVANSGWSQARTGDWPGFMNSTAFRAMFIACFIIAVEWDGSGNSGSTADRHFGEGDCDLVAWCADQVIHSPTASFSINRRTSLNHWNSRGHDRNAIESFLASTAAEQNTGDSLVREASGGTLVYHVGKRGRSLRSAIPERSSSHTGAVAVSPWGCWNSDIAVPWKESLDVLDEGLWSKLSTAATVNRSLCSCGGHTTFWSV